MEKKLRPIHRQVSLRAMELNARGLDLHKAAGFREAIGAFTEALQHEPHSGVIHYNLANSLKSAGEYGASVDHYQKALARGLRVPEVLNNLGIALKDLARYAEAVDCYAEALKLNPSFVFTYANLGYLYIETGETEKAIRPLREAVRLDPQYVDAHWLLSHALLLRGEHEEGWREYEWRWRRPEFESQERNYTQPRWQGEDLAGKTILLWTEQGLGDALQFIRFASQVKQRGGRVVLECQQSLARILKSADGIDAVISRGEPLPHYDVQCPLLSLPMSLGTTAESVPAKVPYVSVDPDIAVKWKEALARDDALKVGVVWAGSAVDHKRSIPPDFFRLLSGLSGVSIYSLQKGAPTAESLHLPFKDYTAHLSDFAETGGLVQALDLVITVDTSVAHLASALGKEVWTLLRFSPDWRWLIGRTDSPWYPTMRLFRQSKPGDWKGVFQEVARELFAFLAKPNC